MLPDSLSGLFSRFSKIGPGVSEEVPENLAAFFLSIDFSEPKGLSSLTNGEIPEGKVKPFENTEELLDLVVAEHQIAQHTVNHSSHRYGTKATTGRRSTR